MLLARTVDVTAAQLLAIATTPVTIVAAPGAGLIVLPVCSIVVLTFVTTPYTDPDGEGVKYGNAAGTSPAFATIDLTAVASRVDVAGPGVSPTGPLPATVVNKALVLVGAGANPTLGDSTLHITCLYVVVPST